jgi:hypothetical protein
MSLVQSKHERGSILLMFAKRSKFIGQFISSISQLKFDPKANHTRLNQLVDAVNTLLVPKAWIGIDSDGLLHVTYMTTERRDGGGEMWKPGPLSLILNVDFAWEYIPWEQAYRCLKCRTGDFSTGQIVKAIDTVDPQKCNPGPLCGMMAS